MKIRAACGRSAFSLIELLVVMAILALLAGLGAAAYRGGSNGDGTRDAASIASGLFSLARNEAVMRRTPAAVLVDGYYDSAQPDNYLRRVAVAYYDTNSSKWVRSAKWTRLPGNVLFNTAFSSSTNSLPGAYSNTCYVYPFGPDGRSTGGVSKFVVSLGSTAGGAFQERNSPNTRYGFMVFPMGHLSFYKDPADIQ